MLSIISTNYPEHNLLALRYYLDKYDCSKMVKFIITLANLDIDIPQWDKRELILTQLHCAHLLARSMLCLNRNQFDCIGIYDKLSDPPKPSNANQIDFIQQLMLSDSLDPDEMYLLSIEKLHFLFNYFNHIIKTGIHNLTNMITISRNDQTNSIIDLPLSNIAFCNGFVKYSDTIKVDFANRKVGGGVLKHGCCQEEIMFLINPELISIMSLLNTLNANKAISVSGITQYSKSSSYGFDLEYAGSYDDDSKQKIIIVDAIDYRKHYNDQYLTENKEIELQKIINGFSLAGVETTISTGHWGCGAFLGNPKLKFMIQWLGVSLTNNQLKYYIGNNFKTNELSIIYNQFKSKSTNDLYKAILDFTKP